MGQGNSGLFHGTKGSEPTIYSGELRKASNPDEAADKLGHRLHGKSRVYFENDPKKREFDAVSKDYIAQTKPALKTLNASVRNQMKASFEAAQQTGRKVYYHFEGEPAKSVIDKLYEYGKRYGVDVVIDTNPFNK